MIDRWTPETAVSVQKHLDDILSGDTSCSEWNREAARRTNGIPAYADLGGIITLSVEGGFFVYDPESESVAPVQEEMWQDVALASLVRNYPDLRSLLPSPPAESLPCSNCAGSGWTMDGRLFCRTCRGRGWIEPLA